MIIWNNVSELLPEDGQWCWVRAKESKPFIVVRSSQAAGGWWNEDTWEDFDRAITHWIAIAEPGNE